MAPLLRWFPARKQPCNGVPRSTAGGAGFVRITLVLVGTLVAVAVAIAVPGGAGRGSAAGLEGVTLTEFEFVRPPDAPPGASFNVAAVSTDGRYLLYEFGVPAGGDGSPGRQLIRRDLTTGEDRVVGINQYTYPVMSRNGRYVAFTAPSNGISLWDADSGNPAQLIAGGAYPSMSDDARFLAYFTGGRNANRIYDRGGAGEQQIIDAGQGTPRLSGDGKLFTIGGCCGAGLAQYDVLTRQLVRSIPRSHAIPLDVSYSGRYVVGFAGGTVDEVGYFWADMETGRYERIPRSADGSCGGMFEHSIAVADDGSWVVFVTNGTYGWDGNELGPNSDGTFDAHGAYFVSIGTESIAVSSASGISVPFRAASNNCGTVVATGDGSIVLFASQYGADWRPPGFGCLDICPTTTTAPDGATGPVSDSTWPPPPDPVDETTSTTLAPPATEATTTTSGGTTTGFGTTVSTTAPPTTTTVPQSSTTAEPWSVTTTTWVPSAMASRIGVLSTSSVNSHILIARRGGGGSPGPVNPPSTPPASTPAVGAPDAPGTLEVHGGGSSASIGWTAPASDGGAAVLEYYVKSSPDGRTCRTAALSCTVTGLAMGKTYTFRVWARNRKGWGSPSVPSETLSILNPCCLAIPGRANSVVSWPADAWPALGTPTGFQVERSSDGGKTWRRAGSLGQSKRSVKVTRLRNGVTYRFRVRAVRGKAVGDWFETDPVTPRTVPGQVRSLRALPGDGSLVVSWAVPSTNGGAAISGYRVQTSTNGRIWSAVTNVGADIRTVVLSDLPNGVKRWVRVVAVNIAGDGRARLYGRVAPKAG